MSSFLTVILVLPSILVILGYIVKALYSRRLRRKEREVYQRIRENSVGLRISAVTATSQFAIQRRLMDTEPVIARSKIVFNDRPTHEDIREVTRNDGVIVVRLHIPTRWVERYPPQEVMVRTIKRVNSMLEELGLHGGHPRVFLMSDTCDSSEQFVEKVYESFGVGG